MFGNTKLTITTYRFERPAKIFFTKMFEDLTNWNRKRFRWRKHMGYIPKNFQTAKRLFLISILLLISGHSCAASSLYLSFNVSENMPSGTAVGQIDGSGSFTKLEESEGVEEAFDLNQLETGKIVTKMELDREHIQQYTMSLFNNVDVGAPFVQVTVNVLDVNDNSPTFANGSITLEVSELASVGTEFNLGSALDEDASPLNVQGYRLDGTDEYFKVKTKLLQDGSTRYAALEVIKKLDRESIAYHTVTVVAFDGGTPTPKTGRITVNVSVSDSNDNIPLFDQPLYNTSISEGAIPGTDVTQVKATDLDAGVNGDITYSIDRTKSDPDQLFRINSDSGTIYINKKLDSETETEHSLTVLATDSGAQPQVGSTIVVIKVEDVNDNQPNISVIFLGSGEFKVSEGAAIGDYIARISVTDPDVGDVEQFNVTLSGGDNRFGLKTENNVVYLVRVKQQLDREEKSSYDVVLNATDFGNPPKSAVKYLTIEVEDINDNPPVFEDEPYHVEISEESFPGTFVYHLLASDADAGRNKEFEFSLESSSQSEWFHLNPDSGLVTTARYLDHEITPEVRLTITATDCGSPRLSSSTTLTVTILNSNDSAPRFNSTSYTKTVSEDIDVGECFLQVHAIDPDFADLSNQIEYSFGRGDAVPLEILLTRTSGKLCVERPLDRETTPSYNFRIKAVDKAGQHAFVRVSVVVEDVNDNSPEFHPLEYFATIPTATSVVGNPVVTVSATDLDATSVDGNGFGDITYRILSGNDEKLFAFDNKTGEITIAKSLRSHGDNVIKLRIDATDGGQKSSKSSATVTINIINSTIASVGGPVFSESHYPFTIREDAASGDFVGTVSANAKDDARVLYHLRRDPPMTDWFTIDHNSGEISLDSAIDREIFSFVKLQIIASAADPPIYGFCDVTITIMDVNDNSPIIQPIYHQNLGQDIFDVVTIPQSLPATAEVYTFNAFDPDEGQNAMIRYRLIDDNEYFAVDLLSGIITVKKPLPNVESNYSVTVQASDHGIPSLSTSATLIIQVLLDNDNCPRFSSSDFHSTIFEDMQLSEGFYNITLSSSVRSVFRIIPATDSYNFAIFPDGRLYLTSKLDREVKDYYQFEIAAESIQANKFSSPCIAMATVHITVDDVNDNVPYFHSYSTQFAVKENVQIGTVIGKVTATDADAGDNAILTYSFASSNQFFHIDQDTGTITTLSQLDREVVGKHAIIVQARDISRSPLLAETTIQVFVDDENDNAPQFLYGSSPVLSVITKDSKDPFVAVLQAVDIDIGTNSDIEYSIIGGRRDFFEIDANTAEINFINDLNLGTTYSLIVQARDHGSTIRKSASIELQVKVVDENSNPSLFSETQYAFFSSVNVKPGDSLGRFNNASTSSKRKKRDVDAVKLTNFYIAEGNSYDHFYVELLTGNLIVLKKPTYEDTPQFKLKVTAENAADPRDIRTFDAQINVQDTNDFSPTFSAASYSLTVREDSSVNTMIWKFSAVDHDLGQNGQLSYTITNQTANSMLPMPLSVTPFRIDAATGQLYTNTLLDREEFPEYILIVKAKDGSLTDPKSSSVSVVITVQDVNDNPPKFVSRNKIQIFEDEPVGFPVLYLTAEDPDFGANSHIIYEITRQWTDTHDNVRSFRVDSSTGLISLLTKLDFETSPFHYLNVSATDSSALDPLTTYQLVVVSVIDINDRSPEFEQSVYIAQVSEDVDAGSLVARVNATDGDSGDNGKVTYELHDQTDTFAINPNNGVITTKKQLDRESVDSYTIVVYAHDGAFPSLYSWCTMHIEVLDVNDNTPQFAFDQDAVFASSGTILASVSVPEYEPYPSHIYTVLATDPDSGQNGNITFSITSGNTGDSFTIDKTSGRVWTANHLDRETNASYHLKIVVTDNGDIKRSSEAYLNIIVTDWNDNDPKFNNTSYQADIREGLPAGQFVLNVYAHDADIGLNGLVTYSIVPDVQKQNEASSIRPEGLFTINADTGAITTKAVLDREQAAIYQFVVQANDSAPYGPRRTSVTVTVNVLDINDNHPVFKESLIIKNISQNTPIGSDVATVTAEDKDIGQNAAITYRISGEKSDNFAIDNDGLVTTTQILSGGYTYYLDVEASDGGSPSLKSISVVTVNVVPFVGSGATKVQFSKNTFFVSLSEGAKKYTTVTQVDAFIVDETGAVSDKSKVAIIYSFHSGNEEDVFAINSSGVITVLNPTLLDYETAPRITLVILATASSPEFADTIAYATISISLTDANDNAPVFEPDRYVTSTFEEEEMGMFVIQVRAHDIDEGLNGEIRYEIESGGNKQNSFHIDHVTGIVTTAVKLDREIHDEYKLNVRANDLGNPQQSSHCVLKVTVIDKNDHEPTLLFLPANGLSISEKEEVGKLITVATANDADTGDVTFQFSTNENNQNEYFTINSDSGKIHLAKPIDYELMKSAVISVQATDGEHIVEKKIVVSIEDVNDNTPVFEKHTYQASLDELSPVKTEVVKIVASDADSGVNSRIRYSLVDIIPRKPAFYINSITGIISTNLSEPYDPHSSIYNLIIMATDLGTPPLNSTVPVRIEIQDINDHEPIFNDDSGSVTVKEDAKKNTFVINVSANDGDFADKNRDVYYEITSGNIDNVFKINTLVALDGGNNIGEIRVAGDLDRETIPSYTLKITAFDHGDPQHSSSTTRHVILEDVNDNQPIFNQSLYSGKIPEDATGEPVVMVFADDLDSSSSLTFKITAGNTPSAFEIGECNPPSAGCALISAIKLDYEEISEYLLSVQVWDGRDTRYSKSSVVSVKIEVLDVNEFSPYYSAAFGFKRIAETILANQSIYTIPAIDPDGGVYGKLIYTIINGENDISSGKSCIPADEMFYIVADTGEVKTKQPLDYEKCHKYFFQIKVENQRTGDLRLSRTGDRLPSYLPVEFEITSVDEYPPVFLAGVDSQLRFEIPYSADIGYFVGQVNATDADGGRDGDIEYEIADEQDFTIGRSSGAITVKQKINSHNAHVLTITAKAGVRSAHIFVAVEITGAPAAPVQAQIIGIVFGVIVVIAIAVAVIVCRRVRSNKLARQQSNSSHGVSSETAEFNDTRKIVPPNPPKMVNGGHKAQAVGKKNQRPENGHIKMANGAKHPTAKNGKTQNGIANGIRPNQRSASKMNGAANGHARKQIFHFHNGHAAATRHSLSSGRGSEQDDDIDVDREVDLINSSSDAANNYGSGVPKVKVRKKISNQGGNKMQVPDSGIQKDMDCGSDISDGPNNIQSPSVESIHIFGDEGAGEEPLSIQEMEEEVKNEMEHRIPIVQSGESGFSKSELGSRYKSSIGSESNGSNSNKSSVNSKRGSDGADSGYGRRGKFTDWTPEFKPLADVFSKLKDHENTVRAGNKNTFMMKDLSIPPSFDANGPPPLITSVAEQRSDLVAPVPIITNRMQQRRSVGNMGVFHAPHPQYLRNSSHPASSSYLPSMYSNAAKTPEMARSSIGYNVNPVRPQVAFNVPTFVQVSPSINSSQQGLSVSSLPRTPISHESSFTSPALSPNLSPSLSPLATRSPSVSTVGEGVFFQTQYDSDDGNVDAAHSKSDGQSDFDDDKNERMVHV